MSCFFVILNLNKKLLKYSRMLNEYKMFHMLQKLFYQNIYVKISQLSDWFVLKKVKTSYNRFYS